MFDWLFGKKKQQPEKKQKKSQKQQQAEDKWMYDFMIQFLTSPLWRVSILDFVDNKCIVFDNQQQNKFQHTIIHNEFKQLVGNLVDGMMEQIGMSQQKLAQIIEKGLQSKQKKLFNQLLLADDFLRFKDLMVKRNKHLQQQAIKALQSSQTKPNQPTLHSQQQNLIRQSKRLQQQRQIKLQQQEEEQLRKVIELSKIQSKQIQAIKALQSKVTDRVKQQYKPQTQQNKIEEQKKLKNSIKPSSKLQPLKNTTAGSKTSQLGDLPPLKGSLNKAVINKQEQQFNNQKLEQVKPEVKVAKQQIKLQQTSQKVEQKGPSQSVQQRKQRLIAQRQKIRKQKQQQRKRQLQQEAKQAKQKQQIVHTIVLQQDGFYDQAIKKETPSNEQNAVSQQQLKRRKELMNKIKNRIIDDF